MRFEVKTASGKACCYGHECKKDPKYISNSGRIIRGTLCARFAIRDQQQFFCEGCFEYLLNMFKANLDPGLRLFK